MSKKLSIGIVGLPNVGKSTLFNAITQSMVEAQNYPFCTIDPNIGIVDVVDTRLQRLSQLSQSEKTIYSTVEFVDIAGLVKGASEGEGLGNKFLSNIRSTSVIAHVVRCFDSSDIAHVEGKVDPVSDCKVILNELIFSDLVLVEKLINTYAKQAKSMKKTEIGLLDSLHDVHAQLEQGVLLKDADFSDEQFSLILQFDFLTLKKQIYVANVDEASILGNQYVDALEHFVKNNSDDIIIISAALEEECISLDSEEKLEYLNSMGIKESGLEQLARACFNMLDLQTFFTSGPKETRSWTILKGSSASQAAGVIHTDFEKGFIRANIVSYDEYIKHGGLKFAKENGVLRQEGKDYVMQDGDVVEFLFNV